MRDAMIAIVVVGCPDRLRTIAIDPDTGSIGTPPTSTVPTK